MTLNENFLHYKEINIQTKMISNNGNVSLLKKTWKNDNPTDKLIVRKRKPVKLGLIFEITITDNDGQFRIVKTYTQPISFQTMLSSGIIWKFYNESRITI